VREILRLVPTLTDIQCWHRRTDPARDAVSVKQADSCGLPIFALLLVHFGIDITVLGSRQLRGQAERRTGWSRPLCLRNITDDVFYSGLVLERLVEGLAAIQRQGYEAENTPKLTGGNPQEHAGAIPATVYILHRRQDGYSELRLWIMAKALTEGLFKDEFSESILPAIKPLFAMKDPPQAMLALLDNLTLFHKKCNATVFREEVLPLIYNALESDIPPVLEKALKVIPTLSEALDVCRLNPTSLYGLANRRYDFSIQPSNRSFCRRSPLCFQRRLRLPSRSRPWFASNP